jgi:hypothetical protein
MKAIIDRIEEDLAVVLVGELGELKLDIPLSFLPAGCKEGDVLKLSIERDPVATKQAREQTSDLMEKLKKKRQSGMIKG